MNEQRVINWLLKGDVSILYQVYLVMEKVAALSRWNTFKARDALKHLKLKD